MKGLLSVGAIAMMCTLSLVLSQGWVHHVNALSFSGFYEGLDRLEWGFWGYQGVGLERAVIEALAATRFSGDDGVLSGTEVYDWEGMRGLIEMSSQGAMEGDLLVEQILFESLLHTPTVLALF